MYRDAEELIVEDTIQMTISYNPSLPGHTHTRGGGGYYVLQRTWRMGSHQRHWKECEGAWPLWKTLWSCFDHVKLEFYTTQQSYYQVIYPKEWEIDLQTKSVPGH